MPNSPLALRIANDIIARIGMGEFGTGSHLATETLAKRFEVSRSPVREALAILCEQGVIENRRNRGFFVLATEQRKGGEASTEPLGPVDDDPYYQLAEDWLKDRIGADQTEQAIRDRYHLTRSQTQDLLSRASREGWAEPKPGYGWKLRQVAKTAEAFEEIYRFRAVIEPAALLEPSFHFDRAVAAALRRTQERLASGNLEGLAPAAMTAAGAEFHEGIIRMSGNPMFFYALERANQLRRLAEYRLKVNPQRIAVQSSEHLQILDLLAKGDNLEAAHLMRRHLSGALASKSPVVHPKSGGADRAA
ncbi:GntR family transcriptional regulator [Bosea sp. (in: a-proteobacteria)]|jgi:DNA-binding GntR family transcriptional regulator|uniref:GntR family transcriptional regulator n=1 Tax=Bosea sp. (in: a-proteobacteria) TaxID=1871050 RepID=UPI002DDCAE41|nr:GntR family transcriptional regulator [Bosea sp. (in: a-proteobacteria)]HEV2512265.1 GntR family transcriptional regulator [Bosea sp. (in: a-proteobacteria)]